MTSYEEYEYCPRCSSDNIKYIDENWQNTNMTECKCLDCNLKFYIEKIYVVKEIDWASKEIRAEEENKVWHF